MRTFHPFTLGFVGYSGSGKTTLLETLMQRFASERRVGYVKHDGHRFEMDREGKDTWRLTQAGATHVIINDADHAACLHHGPLSHDLLRLQTVDCDWVWVEGYKQSPWPKIVVLDGDQRIVPDLRAGELDPVVAMVGPEKTGPDLGERHIPYFQRDNIDGLVAWLGDYFDHCAASVTLNGLVLVGGHSRRMGRDKAFIDVAGQAQVDRALTWLDGHCDNVWVSCREDQIAALGERPTLPDRVSDVGPMGALVSAYLYDKQAAWWLVACDMPGLDSAAFDQLVSERNPFRCATAFQGGRGLEPLCTIYEPKANTYLCADFMHGHLSPARMLSRMPCQGVKGQDEWLMNTNTPEELDQFKQQQERQDG